MLINSPLLVTELTALHAVYEKALMDNDVETLADLFWDSEHAVRYGVLENLYGASEIWEFRQTRTKLNLPRQIERLEVTTFGDSVGIINLQFSRMQDKVLRDGRQSQIWMRFPEGWKIVSAHVSFLFKPGSYVEIASELLSLPVAAEDRASVEIEFTALSLVAQPLLRFEVDQAIEASPVFQP